MKKMMLLLFSTCLTFSVIAQDTTSTDAEGPTEILDLSDYGDANASNALCTQKVINQSPTRVVSLGYEHNLGFKANDSNINGMGGLRGSVAVLARSTNKMILQLGLNYWGSRIRTGAQFGSYANQIMNNRLDMTGFVATMFKPLDAKHFILAQGNVDHSFISDDNGYGFNKRGFTYYGSALYGWKKSDYKMSGFGIARTYRLGRPLFVPIFLYNKTFNDKWGVEILLPARAAVRYNISTTNMLLAGFELEGQQYAVRNSNNWLQRGEIKPRINWERKLNGFIWTALQVGYRVGYRFNGVDKYNGKLANENLVFNWGGSPYFNFSLNFVTP